MLAYARAHTYRAHYAISSPSYRAAASPFPVPSKEPAHSNTSMSAYGTHRRCSASLYSEKICSAPCLQHIQKYNSERLLFSKNAVTVSTQRTKKELPTCSLKPQVTKMHACIPLHSNEIQINCKVLATRWGAQHSCNRSHRVDSTVAAQKQQHTRLKSYTPIDLQCEPILGPVFPS